MAFMLFVVGKNGDNVLLFIPKLTDFLALPFCLFSVCCSVTTFQMKKSDKL